MSLKVKRPRLVPMRLPVLGLVDLTYIGTVTRSISAKAGITYSCMPDSVIQVYDIDVEGLVSLGYFRK